MGWSNLNDRKCPICGELFKPEYPNQKYDKQKCRLMGHKRSISERVQRHRNNGNDKQTKKRKLIKELRQEAIGIAYNQYGDYINQHQTGKGTTYFSHKPCEKVEDEYREIENEYRTLKLGLPPHLRNDKSKTVTLEE